MVLYTLLVLVAIAASSIDCKEICCSLVGCFQDDGIFSHLPLPDCPDRINPKLGLYTRSNRDSPELLSRKTVAAPSDFDPSKRTIFLVHGYRSDYDTEWLHEAKDELLNREDANVVIVGWGWGASYTWYPSSAANTRTVGAEIALITNMLKGITGLSGDNVWCVGFSLGAHTCGFAGMKTEMGRITGLDPAGPWFDDRDEGARLNPAAAKFVDIMHTDGGGLAAYYGLLTPLGHVDYYPNEGKHQPGCWTRVRIAGKEVVMDNEWEKFGISLSCSHSRAPYYFIESIRNPGCFTARHICDDHKKLPNSCAASGETHGIMGYEADQFSTTGILYMEGNRKAPYCQF